jgi:hypothetical protein
MADNVTIPASGSGTATPVIATDDVSSVHFQKIKVDGGGDGATVPIVAGVQASTASLPVVGPNDEFVTVDSSFNRPADTTTYAVNDQIADSTSAPTLPTLSSVVKASGGSGIIIDLILNTTNDPALPLQGELFIFDSSVTLANDNAAFAISDADSLKLVAGPIPFAMVDIGNQHVAHIQGLNVGFTCVGTANLRWSMRAKNAYIPANAETFNLRAKIQRMT